VVDFGAGLEYEYNGYDVDGTFPLYTYFLSLNAPSIKLNANKNNGRVGSYVEGKYKPSSDFLLVAGIRNDYYTLSSKDVTDPRLSVVYRLTKNSFIKGATGIYHQNPALQYFVQGNTTDIKPEQAIHYILGYEYNRDNDYILRVESYYKDYTNLISYDPYSYLTASIGTGTAKGVDVFLKVRLKPKFNGWISYAYTDSKRKQFDAANQTPADYDITHSVSVVATYNLTDRVTVGASYKVSTGKPFTPVTGSMFDPNNSVYIPIYADRNSGRFPTYQRIDLNAQYIFALFGRFAVAFFALNNLLNTSNLYQYNYNFDYSQRTNINSGNKRIIYFGMGLQL
jgi:outer membrane receptor for ferrienterochelin and colicin